MSTTTHSSGQRSGNHRGTARRGAVWLKASLAALFAKVPLLIVPIVMALGSASSHPGGIAGLVPPVDVGRGFVINVFFLASTALFLWWRRWLGVLSLGTYAVLSTIGGLATLSQGYAWWSLYQLATTWAAVVFLALAIARGAIRGRHW